MCAFSAEGGLCRAVLSSRHRSRVIAWSDRTTGQFALRWRCSRKCAEIGDCAVRRSGRCRCALPGARLRISGAAARERSVRSMQDRGCGPSRRSFRGPPLHHVRDDRIRASGRSNAEKVLPCDTACCAFDLSGTDGNAHIRTSSCGDGCRRHDVVPRTSPPGDALCAWLVHCRDYRHLPTIECVDLVFPFSDVDAGNHRAHAAYLIVAVSRPHRAADSRAPSAHVGRHGGNDTVFRGALLAVAARFPCCEPCRRTALHACAHREPCKFRCLLSSSRGRTARPFPCKRFLLLARSGDNGIRPDSLCLRAGIAFRNVGACALDRGAASALALMAPAHRLDDLRNGVSSLRVRHRVCCRCSSSQAKRDRYARRRAGGRVPLAKQRVGNPHRHGKPRRTPQGSTCEAGGLPPRRSGHKPRRR